MNAKTMLLVGSGLILLSMFVPVATVSAGFLSKAMNGYDTDLVFAGGAALIIFLIGLGAKGQPGKAHSPLGALLSVVCIVVVGMVYLNVTSLSLSSSGAAVSTGIAPIMAGIGSVLALVGSLKKEPMVAETPATTTPAA